MRGFRRFPESLAGYRVVQVRVGLGKKVIKHGKRGNKRNRREGKETGGDKKFRPISTFYSQCLQMSYHTQTVIPYSLRRRRPGKHIVSTIVKSVVTVDVRSLIGGHYRITK